MATHILQNKLTHYVSAMKITIVFLFRKILPARVVEMKITIIFLFRKILPARVVELVSRKLHRHNYM